MLAQQVLFSAFDWRSFPWSQTTEVGAGNMDAWDGARAARERVLGVLREKPSSNPVVLTGDVHRAIALEVKDDWREPGSRTLGVEFVSTSIIGRRWERQAFKPRRRACGQPAHEVHR